MKSLPTKKFFRTFLILGITTLLCATPHALAATRFYFDASTAADVTASYDAGWEYQSEAGRYKLNRTKGSSAITIGTQIGPWTAGSANQALDRQYISDPIEAQTISGTVKGQVMSREYNTSDNVNRMYITVKVVSNDGSSVRGTLLALNTYYTNAELISNVTHRNAILANSDTVTNVTAQQGDRILIEIGFGSSTTQTTPEGSCKWGENASDLPENETQTTDGAGWFEFSADITFYTPPKPQFTQKAYQWENDDSTSGVNANSQAAEDNTALTDVRIGQRLTCRMQVENDSTAASSDTVYQLQWENNTDNPGRWFPVGYGTQISYATGLAGLSGASTGTTALCGTPTYTMVAGTWQSGTSQNPPHSMETQRSAEFSFVIDTANAKENKVYRLRLFDKTNAQAFNAYTVYPQLTTVTAANNTLRYSKEPLDAVQNTWRMASYLDETGYDNSASDNSVYDSLPARRLALRAQADLTFTSFDVSQYPTSQMAVGVGDFNNDGYNDLLMGGQRYATYVGRAYLYLGGSPMDSVCDLTMQAGALYTNSYFGSAVAVGDINNDSFDDAVVGNWGYYRMYLYYGSTTMNNVIDMTFTGEATSDYYGYSIGINDVNGDSFKDIVTNAQWWNNGQGRLYVYYGGTTMNNVCDLTINGQGGVHNYPGFACVVEDVNNDSFADILVSSPYYYYSDMRGRAWLWYGGNPMDATCDKTFTGETTGSYFGASGLSIGEVNNDGFKDILIGAYVYSSTKGRSYLFYGATGTSMDITADKTITGNAGDYQGQGEQIVDVNNDDYADLVIGADAFGNSRGVVKIYYGGADMDIVEDLSIATGQTGNYFSQSVNTGDLNNDGAADLIIGANSYPSLTYQGRAWVYYTKPLFAPTQIFAKKNTNNTDYIAFAWKGKTDMAATSDNIIVEAAQQTAMDGTNDETFTGEAGSNFFSNCIALADFNNDHYQDLVLGADGYNSNQGRAYLYYGGTGIVDTAAALTFNCPDTGTNYFAGGGWTVSTGDVNGDLYADLLLGAVGYNTNMGRAFLYLSKRFGLMDGSPDLTLTSPATGTNSFGRNAVGDVNGDGFADMLIGAPSYDTNRGRVYLYYGASTPDATADLVLAGETTGTYFGDRIAVSDVNGDYFSDVLVMAYAYASTRGRAYLYYGGTTMDATCDKTFTGEASNTNFGRSGGIGDIDNDGYGDVVIGANLYATSSGRAYLFWGATNMDVTCDKTFTGETASIQFGQDVSISDLNADSYGDLVVTAYTWNTSQGRAYVYKGASQASFDTTCDLTLSGLTTTDNYGRAARSGDVNNDGFADLVVGAYNYNSGRGRAYLYYGDTVSWVTQATESSLAADTPGWIYAFIDTDPNLYYTPDNWTYWRVYQAPGQDTKILDIDYVQFDFQATAVKLISFWAFGKDEEVQVRWETASESQNLGFNLYRSTSSDGTYTKINAGIISGLGSSLTGKEYSFTDADVSNGRTYYYKLESIEFTGTRVMHGPIEAHPGLDADSDGMSDDWEAHYGLNSADASDAGADRDSDGLTNLQEYTLGTDPTRSGQVSAGASGSGGLTVVSSDSTGITLELRTPGIESRTVTVNKQAYQSLSIPAYAHGYTAISASARMPVKPVMLALPPNAGCSVEILSEETEIFSNYTVEPVTTYTLEADANEEALQSGGFGKTGPLEITVDPAAINTVFYQQDSSYPGERAEVEWVGDLRSQRIACLRLAPLRFNPAKKELTISKVLRVRVTFTQGGAASGNWQLSETAKNARIKIKTEGGGIRRLTWTDLYNAGLTDVIWSDPRLLSMTNLGTEIAIRVKGEEDGIFNFDDYVEFYAREIPAHYDGSSPYAAYAKYSPHNVYFLGFGSSNGKRMETRESSANEGSVSPARFRHTATFEQNDFYWSTRAGGEHADRWFWSPALWEDTSQEYALNLPHVDVDSAAETASVSLVYYPLLYLPQPSETAKATVAHETSATLNGVSLGSDTWQGMQERTIEAEIAHASLITGSNTLKLAHKKVSPAEHDALIANYCTITYWHTFEADSDALSFSCASETGDTAAFTVTGLTTQECSAYDITDPAQPVAFSGLSAVFDPGTNTYCVSFKDDIPAAQERRYLVLADAQKTAPAALSFVAAPALDLSLAGNHADYLIITHSSFSDALEPLKNLHTAQALDVQIIDIEDIYNAFAYGFPTPQAVKDFVSYAYANWKGLCQKTSPPRVMAPTYVLLVGDAHYDYRDNLGTGRSIYVPTYLIADQPNIGETASDNWFACMGGQEDTLADLFIGRLPVRTNQECQAVVSKTIAYAAQEAGGAYTRATFLADVGSEFEQTCESLSGKLSAEVTGQKLYLSDYPSAASFVSGLISSVNSGTLLLTYVGHAATYLWTADGSFDTDSVASLNNTAAFPLVVSLDCLDGYFINPQEQYESLAETFLRKSGSGAVACFSPSGMGMPSSHLILGTYFYKALFESGSTHLGQAATEAKLNYFASTGAAGLDLVHTYNLLGDPALALKIPAAASQTGQTAVTTTAAATTQTATESESATTTSAETDAFTSILGSALANVEEGKKWRDETKQAKDPQDPAETSAEPQGVLAKLPIPRIIKEIVKKQKTALTQPAGQPAATGLTHADTAPEGSEYAQDATVPERSSAVQQKSPRTNILRTVIETVWKAVVTFFKKLLALILGK